MGHYQSLIRTPRPGAPFALRPNHGRCEVPREGVLGFSRSPFLGGQRNMAEDRKTANEMHCVKTRNLTYVILALWVLFGIIIPWFAGALNSMTFLGFPLGYYFCVQGSLIAFVALIWVQNWRQDSIDEEFGHEE